MGSTISAVQVCPEPLNKLDMTKVLSDTVCCGFGCCPNNSYTCNADFSCAGPNGEVIQPVLPSSQPTGQLTGQPPGQSPERSTEQPIVQPATDQAIGSPTEQPTGQPTEQLGNPTGTPTKKTADQPTEQTKLFGKPTALTVPVPNRPTEKPGLPEQSDGISKEQPVGRPTDQPALPDQSTGSPLGQPLDQPTEQPELNTGTLTEQATDAPADKPTGDPTGPGALSLNSAGPVVIVGSNTATLPAITSPTALVTLDNTFILTPPQSADLGRGNTALIVIGTETATLYGVSQTTALVTLGSTVTLPPQSTGTNVPGHTATPVTQQATPPTASQTITNDPASPPTKTGDKEDNIQLPTFTKWPPEAVVTPIEKDVQQPEPSDDDDGDAVIPCKLWFFSICIKFDDINILGWKFKLPQGIYPGGAPPLPIIRLPPRISFQGELPPWPRFTVGPNGVPTFPKQPEPTRCETKTASLCSATTSVAISTVNGKLQTISTHVPAPKCQEVRGCIVRDTTQGATVTTTDECPAATVTDVVITCTGTKACSTKTAAPTTGCSVTPSTTTESCNPSPTGKGRRQADGNVCPQTAVYYVWPREGTERDQTDAIYRSLKELLQDENKIKTSDSRSMGVNFWRAQMVPEHVQRVKDIPNVAAVYREAFDTGGSLVQGKAWRNSDWRYQRTFVKEKMRAYEGRDQLVFVSTRDLSKSPKKYLFDKSAGEDFPVYIIDTGAQIDHPEFKKGDNIASKTEFIHIDEDYDRTKPLDDAALPKDGKCFGSMCSSHGTSMLSLIAGAKLGIAKRVKPYVVRSPRRQPKGNKPMGEDYLVGLSMICDRVSGNSQTTRAIVSLSFIIDEKDFTNTPFNDRVPEDFRVFRKRLYQLLTDLIRKSVFPVAGAGNISQSKIPGWPALFGADPHTVNEEEREGWLHIPELLVVGSVMVDNGKRSFFSSFDMGKKLPHIYAPGDHLLVADGNKAQWDNKEYYKDSYGTSIATAYTAGLAAYFVKLNEIGRLKRENPEVQPDTSPVGLKAYIVDTGVARAPEEIGILPVAIWNGADWDTAKGKVCYKPKGAFPPLIPRQQDDVDNGDDEDGSANQCILDPPPTGNPTEVPKETATGTASDSASATGTDVNASGTTTATATLSMTASATTETPVPFMPPGFVCTEETVHQCMPVLICAGLRRNACKDGKCVCIVPDAPAKEPPPLPSTVEQTTLRVTTRQPGPAPTEKPNTPLEVGQRHCHDYSIYPNDKIDITDNWVKIAAQSICKSTVSYGGTMYAGKKDITYYNNVGSYVPYFMAIRWKKGCEMDMKVVDPAQPIIGVHCTKLMYFNWLKCGFLPSQCANADRDINFVEDILIVDIVGTGNKGRGGYIDVGCLRYEFTPGHGPED
ncbi:hypothetical protein AJ79_07006 [Helicocarpus griseus UAMH5409]|uniref:Peptidase S8/S53 domain-containing protein n=1 Tax=Helicocarpus griseus UAMH5409 TaxID=1447875 RepID=A0A2B7X7N4_9EURO|nr:hypothetical protein AJ79_07006 [Helicocarpus griseus UAMH5409]